MNYVEAVTEAKGLMLNRERDKMRIAQLAYETCDIIVGGHIVGDVYSLTMFAKDTGINRKTLSDWVHNYEINLIIEEEEIEKEEVKIEKPKKNKKKKETELNDIRKILRAKDGGLKKNINGKMIKEAIDENAQISSKDHRLKALNRGLHNINTLLSDKRDLPYMDQEELSSTHDMLIEAKDKLDRYFTSYDKKESKYKKKRIPIPRGKRLRVVG